MMYKAQLIFLHLWIVKILTLFKKIKDNVIIAAKMMNSIFEWQKENQFVFKPFAPAKNYI